MSREALASMRVSDYLFARKFEVGSYNPEDIDILVASNIMQRDAPLTPGTTVQAPLIFMGHTDPDNKEVNGFSGDEWVKELLKLEPSETPLEVPVRMPLVVLRTKVAIKNDIARHSRA